MQPSPIAPSVAAHTAPQPAAGVEKREQSATCEPVDTCETAQGAAAPSPAAGVAPTPPGAAQPSMVDRVAQALGPVDQGVAALHAALLQRYAFDPVTLQMHRAAAVALVKPWGLLARVQEVVRSTDPQALATLAAALADPQMQMARAQVEMAANMLNVSPPSAPGPTQSDLEPDLQLLHKLSPKLAAQSNPALLAQARQFIQQSMPAGAVSRALQWLDHPAYPTLVQLERATAEALQALPEAAAAADSLARQLAPAQLHQCDEALQQEPRNSAARRVRANLASKIEGKHDAAVADLTDVLERDGMETDYASRGDCYAALGQWAAAEQDYGRAALFAASSDRSLQAYLKMALRSLDAQHPTVDAAPLAVQARRATLVLGLEGHAAAAPAIAALRQAAPEDPEVQGLLALAATYEAAPVALPAPASIAPTPTESDVGPITGQPLAVLPVFTRLAARLDVMEALIARALAALEEDFGLFPEVVAPVRLQLLAKSPEFTTGVAEALQKVCSAQQGHAIEGMLTGATGALVLEQALPLGERVHTALTGWLRDIGGSLADVRVPRNLRGTPLRQLLQTLDPEAPAAAGGALGALCDHFAGQLRAVLSPQDLASLLALMQTEPFVQLCAASRQINAELLMALQSALGEALPHLAEAQCAASDARLEADPDDVLALTGRAMARMALGDAEVDATQADLDRLLALSPTAQNYRRRAAWHLLRQQPDAALADATQGLRIAPRASPSYVMRSQAYLARGSMPEALQDAMQATFLAVSAEESMRAQMALSMAYQEAQAGGPPTAA